MIRFTTSLIAIGLAAALTAQAPPAPSTARGEWPTYGGDLANSQVLAARSDHRRELRIAEDRVAREVAGRRF